MKVGNKWSWCENDWTCPVEKLGIFSGKLSPRIVLILRIEFILLTSVRKSSTSSHTCVKKLNVSWCSCHKGAWDRERAWQCYEFWEREKLQVAWQAPAGLSQGGIYLW